MSAPTPAKLEKALLELHPVRAARVVMGKTRLIDEVHLLADSNAAPKAVVRQARSLLISVTGDKTIDHRCISVVNIDGVAPEDLDKMPATNRVSIESVETTADSATVVLTRRGKLATGVYKTSDGEAEAALVARATISALRELDPKLNRVDLEHALIAQEGDRAWAIVSVALLGQNNTSEVVGGCAVVREPGENMAVARAVLDATNRRIAR